jgi:3-oxoadipate CoA-transferase, alpha subunit
MATMAWQRCSKRGVFAKCFAAFQGKLTLMCFDALYRSGQVELELVPQGNLAERIRAAGAGIGGFFSPTGYGTDLAKNADGSLKETREINGRMYVYETPIHGDLALIRAERGDRWGNLTFRKSARNFGPVMAMAARKTVASVYEKAELGGIDPETVITPGIFVHAVVHIPRVATQAGGI